LLCEFKNKKNGLQNHNLIYILEDLHNQIKPLDLGTRVQRGVVIMKTITDPNWKECFLAIAGLAASIAAYSAKPYILPWALPVFFVILAVLYARPRWLAFCEKVFRFQRPFVKNIYVALLVFVILSGWVILDRLIYDPIEISEIKPSVVFQGEQIKIKGNGFDSSANSNIVELHSNGRTDRGAVLGLIDLRPMILDVKLPEKFPVGRAEIRVKVAGRFWRSWWSKNRDEITVLGEPEIKKVDPSVGFKPYKHAEPTQVVIHGLNFDTRQGNIDKNFVWFDDIPSKLQKVDVCEQGQACLYTTVPPLVDDGKSISIRIRNPGGTKEEKNAFYILGQPKISDVKPLRGYRATDDFPGSKITIVGTDFDPAELNHNRNRNIVRIRGVNTKPVAASQERLVARIPAGCDGGLIEVITPAGNSSNAINTDKFEIEIVGKPKIYYPDKNQLPPGAKMTISGRNFYSDIEQPTKVTIGGIEGNINNISEDGCRIEITVPLDVQDGDIVVRTPAGPSLPYRTFQVVPEILGFSPSIAQPGDIITIYGRGFRQDMTILFGDQQANPINLRKDEGNRDAVNVKVPSGVSSVPIYISLGQDRIATSPQRFEVSRFGEVYPRIRQSREVEVKTHGIHMILQAKCDENVVIYKQFVPKRDQNKIGVGQCPVDIVIDKNRLVAYVANLKSNDISVIDLQSKTAKRLGSVGSQPTRIEMLNDRVYFVGTEGGFGSISISNPSDVKKLDSRGKPLGMIRDEEGIFLALISTVGPEKHGTLTVFSAKNPEIPYYFALGKDPRHYLKYRQKIYVTNYGSDSISVFEWRMLWTKEKKMREIRLPEAKPFDLAIHPKKTEIFVTASGLNKVVVIDTQSDKPTGDEIIVGPQPFGIAFSPSGCQAAVVNSGNNTLSIVNPETYSMRGEPRPIPTMGEVVDVKFEGDSKVKLYSAKNYVTMNVLCKRDIEVLKQDEKRSFFNFLKKASGKI